MIHVLPEEVTSKYDTSDDWWKSTTVYQIYPRSYQDSDGDGIGDIAGIISRLDYIDSLGFETIWISPFFESPQKDHGYDISDYREIDPVYGNMYWVDTLISEIHRRNMKIVLDMVLNHTSDQHDWFLESKSSRNNPKSDWYIWKDGVDGEPPNNWKNILGQESAWNYVEERKQWYYAAFLPFQPDLNMHNPEVREAIFDMVRFWLDKGVDGMRLDIFNFIFEDDQFRNNPFTMRYLPDFNSREWTFQEHLYNFHQPENIYFAKDLRQLIESYEEEKFMVGEVFGSHLHMRELLGMENHDGLNLVFLFDFIDHFDYSASYFYKKVKEYEKIYPSPLIPTYVFSNHDQTRSISRLENDPEKAQVLAAFQLTVRGVPFTYMGEEIGMKTANISLENARDPLANYWKKFPSWLLNISPVMLNRDNCRTPMQWDDSENAGFSSAQDTWLPVQEDFTSVNVSQSFQDEGSLLNLYKELLSLRKIHSELHDGQLELISSDKLPEDVFGYHRVHDQKKILILFNFSTEEKSIRGFSIEKLLTSRSVSKDHEIILGQNGIFIGVVN